MSVQPATKTATNEPKPVPSGAMVEITLDLIDEGKLRRAIDRSIRDAHRSLMEFRETEGEPTCKARVTLHVELSYDKDMGSLVQIAHQIRIKPPTQPVRATFVKEVNGRLLAQPTGSSEGEPEQTLLFTAGGHPMGVADLRTMTLIEEEEKSVAGKVGDNSAS